MNNIPSLRGYTAQAQTSGGGAIDATARPVMNTAASLPGVSTMLPPNGHSGY